MKSIKVAQLECIEDVVIYGRNEDGSADVCFKQGNSYIFAYHTKTNNLTIVNDVHEIHSFGMSDTFRYKHFDVVSVDNIHDLDLDDLSKKRLINLHDSNYEFLDEED